MDGCVVGTGQIVLNRLTEHSGDEGSSSARLTIVTVVVTVS